MQYVFSCVVQIFFFFFYFFFFFFFFFCFFVFFFFFFFFLREREERFACEGWVVGLGKLYLRTFYGSESGVGSREITWILLVSKFYMLAGSFVNK